MQKTGFIQQRTVARPGRRLLAFTLLTLVIALFLWARWVPPADTLMADLVRESQQPAWPTDTSSAGSRPLLVVLDADDSNAFARYITEVLVAEGIFAFDIRDISSRSLDSLSLASHALTIVATASPRLRDSRAVLTDYLGRGGRLFMIAPPADFDTVLGLRDLAGSMDRGYVRFDTSSPPARGLTPERIQFFGPARLCARTTSTLVAGILPEDPQGKICPAFGINRFGNGIAGYCMYDLGKSVVITRQGIPPEPGVHASRDRDGDGVFRTADLYFDTFDYAKASIPQADEQQKLFANILYTLLDCSPVVPRVWYFPDGQPSVALITGDSHYTASETIRRLAGYVESRGGHFTLLDYPDATDTALAHALLRQGNTVQPHIFYPRPGNRFPLRLKQWIADWFSSSSFFRPRFSDLADEVRYGVETYHARMGVVATSTRTHYLVWWGWDETAELLAHYGIRMDFSVTGMDPRAAFSLPSSGGLKSPSGYGYINGSGLPMRWISREGRLIDIYAQLTEVEDDVIAAKFITSPPNDSLTFLHLYQANRQLIDNSVALYHSALVWNLHPFHTVERFPPEAPLSWNWATATIDYLAACGVPMISADAWLDFVRGRNALRFDDVRYTPVTARGSFLLRSPRALRGITLLIPIPRGRRSLQSISVQPDGTDAPSLRPAAVFRTVGGSTFQELRLDLAANTLVKVLYAF